MPYMLLVVEDAERRRNRAPEDGREAYERMSRFREGLEARGILRACDSLRPDAEGARVVVRNGRRIVVDGPFAELKEVVGGFFLIDCQTKEQAIAIAAQCPATEWATLEVREVGPCWTEGGG